MDTKQTPAERAGAALSNSRTMCDLLAECREFRVPGWWDGSAYRSHPVGLIVDTIKLTNYWHVDRLCDICITDGSGWSRTVSQDSFGHGSPHPDPIDGKSVLAWRCGSWASPEMETALKPRVIAILTEAAEHIERQRERWQTAEAAREAEAKAKAAAIVSAAIARATGAA